MGSPIGERFGPYVVVAPLGRGGMGETFVAERTGPAGFAQRVCLKRIREGGDDAAWVRMFQTEARLVAMLAHPNVVSLVDFGQEKSVWWMALALVDGADLRTVMSAVKRAGGSLTIEIVAAIAIELAKGLAHAHSRRLADGAPARIVHRDVSPGNVMVSTDGAVLLTDFGIGKIAHAERTRTGILKGKAEYMSPDDATGDPLDGRADLFSLGVVMFELLTGTRPFVGPTDLATRMAAVRGERPRLEALRPDAPPVMVKVIDTLLDPNREKRFPDARALVAALDAIPVRPSLAFELGALAEHARNEHALRTAEATQVELPTTRVR